LIWGELPTKEQLKAFEHEVRHHRRIKYRIRDMMKCFPESGHPMDALQALQPLLWAYSILDLIILYILGMLSFACCKIPTMVAAFQLMRKGNDPAS